MNDDWASYALADFIPFTPEVYFQLIERVNVAWWPLQFLGLGLGLTALALAWRGAARLALLLLVPAWVASGVIFHLRYYAELTWAAPWFGATFLVQAALLFGFALVVGAPGPRPGRTVMARAGAVLALFGVAGYPVIAPIIGPGWHAAEIFALHPDPTAVATLGVVVVALGGIRAGLAALVPLLWLAVTTLALIALQAPSAWVSPSAVLVAVVVSATTALAGGGRPDGKG